MGSFDKFNNPKGIEILSEKIATLSADQKNAFLQKLRESDGEVYQKISQTLGGQKVKSAETSSEKNPQEEIENMIEHMDRSLVLQVVQKVHPIFLSFVLRSVSSAQMKKFLSMMPPQNFAEIVKLIKSEYSITPEKIAEARTHFMAALPGFNPPAGPAGSDQKQDVQASSISGAETEKNMQASLSLSFKQSSQFEPANQEERLLFEFWDKLFKIKAVFFLLFCLAS